MSKHTTKTCTHPLLPASPQPPFLCSSLSVFTLVFNPHLIPICFPTFCLYLLSVWSLMNDSLSCQSLSHAHTLPSFIPLSQVVKDLCQNIWRSIYNMQMSEFVCIFLISYEHKWLPNLTRCEICCEIRSSLCSTCTEWVMSKETCVIEVLTCIFCLIWCTTSVSHSVIKVAHFVPLSHNLTRRVFLRRVWFVQRLTLTLTHTKTHTYSLNSNTSWPMSNGIFPWTSGVYRFMCSIHKSGSSLVFLSIHS